MIELLSGRWQERMYSGVYDALITDPPFSGRTHDGFRTNAEDADEGAIKYPPITREDCHELAVSFSPRVRWWVVIFGDHVSFAWHEEAWKAQGWYTFAPVGWILTNPPPRNQGDGPACSVTHILVARRHGSEYMGKEAVRGGSRPPHYLVPAARGFAGGKDLGGMMALVKDYTLPGDMIADPYAGRATTLVAARQTGRKCRGAEMMKATYDDGLARIGAPFTPDLFGAT